MSKSMLIAGAIINLLFGLFHVLLTWRVAHVTGAIYAALAAQVRRT